MKVLESQNMFDEASKKYQSFFVFILEFENNCFKNLN